MADHVDEIGRLRALVTSLDNLLQVAYQDDLRIARVRAEEDAQRHAHRMALLRERVEVDDALLAIAGAAVRVAAEAQPANTGVVIARVVTAAAEKMKPEPVAAPREETEHVGAESETVKPALATTRQGHLCSLAAMARPAIGAPAPKPVPVVRLPPARLPSVTPDICGPAPKPASISAARRAFEIEAMAAHNPTPEGRATPKQLPSDDELIKPAREIEVDNARSRARLAGNVRSQDTLPPKPMTSPVAVLRRFGDMHYESGVGGGSFNARKRRHSSSVRSVESEQHRQSGECRQQKMLKEDPADEVKRSTEGRNHHRRDEPVHPRELVRYSPPRAVQQWNTAAVPRAVLERCLGLKEATQIIWPVNSRGDEDVWGRPVVILSQNTQPHAPVTEKAEGIYYSLIFELNIRAQPFPILVAADWGYRYIGNYILQRGDQASNGLVKSLGNARSTAVVSEIYATNVSGGIRLKAEMRTLLLQEGVVQTRDEGERMTIEECVRRLKPMSKDYKGPVYEQLRLFMHRLVFDSFDSDFLERYILHYRR